MAGGLVGNMQGGQISASFATGPVTGNQSVGGLVGQAEKVAGSGSNQIIQSYSLGSVSGNRTVGGLVGGNFTFDVTESYATGAVTGSTYVGGIAGYNYNGTITSTFWDTGTTNQANAVGAGAAATDATGLTTALMHDGSNNPDGFYTLASGKGWDFQTVWSHPNDETVQSSDNQLHYAELYQTSGVVGYDTGFHTMTYGDTAPTLSGTGYGIGGAYGNTVNTAPSAFVSGASSTADVGTYAGYGTGADGTAWTGGALRFAYSGTTTINKRQITVTANAQSRIYGNANPILTYVVGGQDLVNNDTLSGTLATTADQQSNVGSYAITQGTLANKNYEITSYTGANLTLTQRPITVTANAQSRIYGDANPFLSYAVGGDGLVNGDTLSGTLSTAATVTSNVGSYAITQGSLANDNYEITSYTGATLNVSVRPITVTANAQSRVYGDVNPTLTYTMGGDGLVNGDSLSGTLATTAATMSNVGSYAITRGTLAASSNYDLTYVQANLAVTQRPITVTANAQSRVYGDVNPTLTYTMGGDGLVNGDSLSGTLATTAATMSNVGSYAITRGTLAASSNYDLTYVQANLTVTQRPITVTANAQSRVYGDVNPTLTYTMGGDGLVNGDSLSGTLATTAATMSNVGSYAITGAH